MSRKVVIVGGVAGGASAAARLRRLDEEAQIVLFEKGEYISFANCGLPYYIGGVINSSEKLLVQTPEGMKSRFNIDVRVSSEVTAIDPQAKTVEVLDGATGRRYTESYDKLVLSPGAEPLRPKIPGAENDKIFTLRNIPDTYQIKKYVDERRPRDAMVVGAGFIGLEVAENLHARGVRVTIVELADHVIGPLDYEMAAAVHQHLKTKGVQFYLKDAVTAFEQQGEELTVRLSSGRALKTDMVIMGVGVRPETRLAVAAGLKLGKTGGILVDEHMLSSDENIYALGDAAEVRDFPSGGQVLIPLAGPANKQGRIAANNICGANESYGGTQGTSIVRVFDITVAVTGSNERQLKKIGAAYEKSYTHSPCHASYYPGAIPMSIKLLFSKPEGKILGAQIVGYDGVDKRLDVLATAMRAGMTVHDLERLELCYAPPFSSAKDPVNLAGYTASNILKGDCAVFHWDEVASVDPAHGMLLDVRTPEESSLGTIEGAVNIPVDELRSRLSELPRDKTLYVFCQVGLRGYVACRLLMQHGFSVKNLSGGYMTWHLASEKQSNGDIYTNEAVTRSDDLRQVAGESGADATVKITLDACGLQCPGPILKLYGSMKGMNEGEVLEVRASDPAFADDARAWCRSTGNRLLDIRYEGGISIATIKKEARRAEAAAPARHDKAMIVFSNDLDKAIAAFIIANGAAAMGRSVTLFFTFWGLNILRKPKGKPVKKDFIAKMFGFMMPKGSRKLSLSKMNMAGIGPKMIRSIMHRKEIASLEELIEQALKNGVKFIACSMSMDVMGIKREELIDEVTVGGVASFLGKAEESDMSLFI
ncbi:MAG: FAD-dependent oxidoreductase [Clostridia bacterium]|nr:FAD-dependent oxidoreductase [Clostridia bacterium]